MRIIFLILPLLFCVSCLPGGDAAMKVQGKIVSSDGEKIEGCTINLFDAKNEKYITKRRVESEFMQTFVCAPQPYDYYFVVECDGHAEIFRSEIYGLGKDHPFEEPINLGEIVL